MPRSVGLPTRSPAKTPPRMPSGTTTRNAYSASLRELPSAGSSDLPHGQLGRDERVTEVSLHRSARPVEVLHDHRPVGAVLAVVLGHDFLRRVPSEHRSSEVAREELRRGEHDHAEQDERDQRKTEALEDVAGHLRLWLAGRPKSRSGRPLRFV